MEKKIRLIYPQWQGADISAWIPNIPAKDSSRGYYLGAMLLNWLAPESDCESFTVPVSTNYNQRIVKDGIIDKDIIVLQTKAALNVLDIAGPDKVLTLGGECSVSVPVFTWLNKKYNDDVAVIWIDQHPDVTLPGDKYTGYHAMALTACLGLGDNEIMNILPSKISPKNVCLAGVRDYEYSFIEERVKELGLVEFSASRLSTDTCELLKWIESTGKKNILIHFDMDVLDPSDIVAAVADTTPGGLKLQQAVRIINDIAGRFNVVALTVAEPMPRVAIRLKQMLSDLPLVK